MHMGFFIELLRLRRPPIAGGMNLKEVRMNNDIGLAGTTTRRWVIYSNRGLARHWSVNVTVLLKVSQEFVGRFIEVNVMCANSSGEPVSDDDAFVERRLMQIWGMSHSSEKRENKSFIRGREWVNWGWWESWNECDNNQWRPWLFIICFWPCAAFD